MSQPKTLKQFYLDNFITGVYDQTPFIDTSSIAYFDLAEEFSDYIGDNTVHPFQFVDRDYLCVKYGSLYVCSAFLKYDNDPVPWTQDTDVMNVLHSVYFKNAYKWKEYYKTLWYDYEPLWNVDGTEKTEHGDYEIEHDYAQKILTMERGSTKISNLYAQADYTTINENVPVDSATLQTTQKVTNSTPLHTDTVSSDAVINKDTDSAHKDTDTHKKHDITVTRQGNIGVTSTQNLIGQQRQIIDTKFYDMVFKDIVKEITIPYYG